MRKSAQTTQAQAAQREAQARAQTAETLNAEAQADITAKQAGLDAVADRQKIEADTASKTPSEVQSEQDQWRKWHGRGAHAGCVRAYTAVASSD